MKTVSRVTVGLGLLLGSGVGAMAGISRLQNDVDFSNEVTVTDRSVYSVESFSEVTAPGKKGDSAPTPMAAPFFPGTSESANTGASKYTDSFVFTNPIGSGEKGGLSNSVFSAPTEHIASVADIVATPEPSELPLLGAGAILIGMLVRRKLLRVS